MTGIKFKTIKYGTSTSIFLLKWPTTNDLHVLSSMHTCNCIKIIIYHSEMHLLQIMQSFQKKSYPMQVVKLCVNITFFKIFQRKMFSIQLIEFQILLENTNDYFNQILFTKILECQKIYNGCLYWIFVFQFSKSTLVQGMI